MAGRTLQSRAPATEADASYKQPVPDTPKATAEEAPAANRRSLTRFAWLSIAAALLTIGLKTAAYLLTGSVGLLSDAIESLVNLGVALLLLRVGRKAHSITLEANAHHLMTDVWTSVGVVVGVGAVALTGWQRLDPIVALLVAANIVWTGVSIVRRSVSGLMDVALSAEELGLIQKALEPYRQDGLEFHALRTRRAGASRFVTLHVLVPGDWTVQRGHQLLERLEDDIRRALPDAIVFTHLEALGDPASEKTEPGMTPPTREQHPKRPGTEANISTN
jgi:divalent metal cation (Fe/Co/Zn/Cd) transporter